MSSHPPTLSPGRKITPPGVSARVGSFSGGIYASISYTRSLAEIGIRPSIGTIGDSYDNSLAESFNGLYKHELIKRQSPSHNDDHIELATLIYIEWFNHRRLHSEIGDIPPEEMETNYYNNHRPQPQAPTPTRT